jgi:hypothetical protein
MKELKHANAFVVQFRLNHDIANGTLSGRVEHVSSGRTANFKSVFELPELLRQMLNEAWHAEQSGVRERNTSGERS